MEVAGAEPYYEALTRAFDVQVRMCANDARGKGVFTTRPFAKGESVFMEVPLAAMQTVPNKQDVLVCGRCFRFIGAREQHADLLARRMARTDVSKPDWSLPAVSAAPDSRQDVIYCKQGCGECFCGPDCHDRSFAEGHDLVCVGPVEDEQHPLLQFKVHAVSTNEAFMLAGQIVSNILSKQRLGATVEEAMRPYLLFDRKPWWETAVVPADSDLNEEEFSALLRAQATESLELLQLALGPAHPDSAAVFTLDFYGGLIGTFEMNNLGILLPTPLHDYCVAASKCPDRQQEEVLKVLRDVAAAVDEAVDAEGDGDCGSSCDDEECAEEGEEEDEEMEDNDGQADEEDSEFLQISSRCFPPLDGTGLFALACCMNHSCAPNVHTTYTHDPTTGALIANVTATRDMGEGEEVCQCYIEKTQNFADRTEALQGYGFECDCPRCVEDRAAAA